MQDPSRWTDYGSFTTGAYDSYVLVGSTGPSGGIQINLSILGARLFLGRPLRELKNRAVELEDVLGRDARRLIMELYDAPTWEARFTILDRELASRILTAKQPSAAVMWAWCRLVQTGGRISIGTLVDEVGFSQRHLIGQFREQIGLSPKTLARVLRFGRAIRIIKSGGRAQSRRDCPGLRLLRPGALLTRLPHLCRRHADRAGAKPASGRRRLPRRQVRFVQDLDRAPRIRSSVEDVT